MLSRRIIEIKKITNTEDFVKKANIIHNSKYDYSKVEYILSKEKVCIICPEHGEFWQSPNSHLDGHGCPICNSSKGEIKIQKVLDKHNIVYTPQYKIQMSEQARNSNYVIVDFLVKYDNRLFIIEYNGEQHYNYIEFFHKNGIEDLYKQQRRDNVLRKFCELNSKYISLLEIPYNTNDDDIEQIILTFINFKQED